MQNSTKYDQIIDALETLLTQKPIQDISVSEIAQTAGIAKEGIYYYFSSKNEILEAMIERKYKHPLETAKHLADQKDISPFTRMAMIFQACRNSNGEFLTQDSVTSAVDDKEQAFLHQKYIQYLVTELKPVLTEIIQQGIESGAIDFDYPAALSEIVLIVLTVKLDRSLIPTSDNDVDDTIAGLISLLEKGTGTPAGTLNYLKS